MDTDEVFVSVVGYEGIYSVSNLGRIRRDVYSKGYPAGMILAPTKIKNGYTIVRLWKSKKGKALYIHRLVATAFLGECPEKHEVNHKNSIRDDNRLENLEYVTRSGNNLHAYRVGGKKAAPSYGSKNFNWKITDDQVREIRVLHKNGESYAKIARTYNVEWTSIRSIVKGETHKYVI